MSGTKFGGYAAPAPLDGQPVRSCQTQVDNVGDSAITTIEAIRQTTQDVPNRSKLSQQGHGSFIGQHRRTIDRQPGQDAASGSSFS